MVNGFTDLLEVCAEAVERQREMLPALARAVGVSTKEVFYTWGRRACQQHGQLSEPGWRYFFHGLECDLENVNDGRRLRLDFGPQGTVETMTAWGIFQFLFCSVRPWREFPELRARYRGPTWEGDDYRQGFTEPFLQDWDGLKDQGALAPAAPKLVELEAACTTRGADGLATIRFPAQVTEEERLDCSVAHRLRITAAGQTLLAGRSTRGARHEVLP